MDLYLSSLVVLAALLAAAAFWQFKRNRADLSLFRPSHGDQVTSLDPDADSTARVYFEFRSRFLMVYGLAIAADWLQGSFMYSLYKTTHQLAEPTIASLFATGFLCGAISATFVGALADAFGRKLACLSYCLLYSLSCLTVLSGNLSILYLGRVLGGVSTTLLFTAFETWMIAEYRRLGLGHLDGALSSIYGMMSILNGSVAVMCGISAEFLVYVFESETAPFLASVACLGLAAIMISRSWVENYGAAQKTSNFSAVAEPSVRAEPGSLLAIGFTSCFLEGAMYIMVYSWSQAIISAREVAQTQGSPPFGLIFANFMCAMTLGSFSFTYLTRNGNSIQLSSHSVQLLLSVAASSMLLTILTQSEAYRFWALCVFEFCLGIYFPSMAYLKGNLISNEQRAKIYGFIRVPLNAFVVISLATVNENANESRENRFTMCSGLLLLAIPLMARYVPRSALLR